MPQEVLIKDESGKVISFTREDTVLRIKSGSKGSIGIPYRQILRADFQPDSGILTLVYLRRKKQTDPFGLVELRGVYQGSAVNIAAQWVESLMTHTYEDLGVKRQRRLKVLVNPHGGVRKGITVFMKTVEPILRAARCSLDVTHTTHQGHAFDIAKHLHMDYDAIVIVSGDGLVHEVLNGFAQHEDPRKALSIPLAPIPTGSGNGLALNLLGPEHGFDVTEAALNVIKGKQMKVDVFSLTQGGKRTISFMSQALGLMADLDIGTENLRWMGDTRFVVGLLRGILKFKACPVQLSYKVAESDKIKMAEDFSKSQAQRNSQAEASTPHVTSGALPPLVNLPDDMEGWTTYDKPILYVYAGKGPFVGRDYMAFPVSQPDDGLIDVMAQPVSSRKEILSSLGGAAKGETYWQSSLHYVKAHAYRIKPLGPKGSLAVDGEIFPFEEFQVEVHQNEKEREANIARNRALLEELELKQAVAGLGFTPTSSKPAPKSRAQPVQSKKRVKKVALDVEAPRRQSSRLKRAAIDLDESPLKRQKREAELEVLRAQEAEARLEAEERARMANRPRRHDLELSVLLGEEGMEKVSSFATTLQVVVQEPHSKRVADPEAFTYGKDNKREEVEVSELRERLQSLRIVSRAKVTQDRVYSAAYHPEISKDLIFFGDKHGQLGIWDARAPPDEVTDEDGEAETDENGEGGKYWRLQVYTSSYDCSVRCLSFETSISRQVYANEDGTLISSIDLDPTGNEMWLSDSLGGVTHLDLRENESKTRWYGLSEQKIGCISLNPTRPHFLLTASNNRSIWDIRKLTDIAVDLRDVTGSEFGSETVNDWLNTDSGKGCLRAEWRHDKSVSSAYWDPRGRSIVSTSYDDKLRRES
ncbi:hypothetical protein C0992_009052 [Termitomyces sp. T32_za158]|nr:hypothetical protein C0992_009052 [Termitomyces sp. T32_za158]